MNKKALTIHNPRMFVGIPKEEENQNTERKTESYVLSGFGNGISRG